ncbi:helix-turn-helix domain-containing protein [Ligilactobacillus agilis]|uniref:helix-turn-helix domain-containing protein n=1 Tax=Ligilactobacillus agilis TaxID=1601 RepID=UPI0024328CCA|nr:helix-turn-helix transcriptional regulator [Ligilactobacillus agilis]
MNLRDRIKALAVQNKISVAELERTLGFGNGSISKWNKQSPSVEKLKQVADFFHVSMDYLLGREEAKTPSNIEIENLLNQSMTFEGRKLTGEEKIMMIEVFKAYLKTKK